jgi:hypothetical protein
MKSAKEMETFNYAFAPLAMIQRTKHLLLFMSDHVITPYHPPVVGPRSMAFCPISKSAIYHAFKPEHLPKICTSAAHPNPTDLPPPPT